jgi:hypothetical protein
MVFGLLVGQSGLAATTEDRQHENHSFDRPCRGCTDSHASRSDGLRSAKNRDEKGDLDDYGRACGPPGCSGAGRRCAFDNRQHDDYDNDRQERLKRAFFPKGKECKQPGTSMSQVALSCLSPAICSGFSGGRRRGAMR